MQFAYGRRALPLPRPSSQCSMIDAISITQCFLSLNRSPCSPPHSHGTWPTRTQVDGERACVWCTSVAMCVCIHNGHSIGQLLNSGDGRLDGWGDIAHCVFQHSLRRCANRQTNNLTFVSSKRGRNQAGDCAVKFDTITCSMFTVRLFTPVCERMFCAYKGIPNPFIRRIRSCLVSLP